MKVILVFLALLSSIVANQKELTIYNWSAYMPNSVLINFTKETGIKINYSTYDSNEEMYEKLKTPQGAGCDIVFPSSYYVSRMIREGLLEKLDKTKLNNYANIDPKLLSGAFDPQNEYSVPYLWGSTGITYNTALTYGDIDSWSDLWDERYKQSVLLNDDMREVFGMALKVLGYSPNSINPKEIEAAYNKLLELKPNIKLYDSESQKKRYLDEEVKLGMNFSGEGFMAKEENQEDKISQLLFGDEVDEKSERKMLYYVYPKEGALMWMDSLVIPKGAKNIENAHIFINYILKPEVAKAISQEIGYASPNLKAIELLDKSTRSNRTIYPTKENLKNSSFQVDIGDALAIYEKYWKLLKEEK